MNGFKKALLISIVITVILAIIGSAMEWQTITNIAIAHAFFAGLALFLIHIFNISTKALKIIGIVIVGILLLYLFNSYVKPLF